MGKSTLMKVIFVDIINRGLGVPLFVELRRLTNDQTILDEIKDQLNALAKQFDSDDSFRSAIDWRFYHHSRWL